MHQESSRLSFYGQPVLANEELTASNIPSLDAEDLDHFYALLDQLRSVIIDRAEERKADPISAIPLLERFRGSLLGLAAGYALGTTLEFEPPGTFSPITDMVGGGPFDLLPG